MKNRKRIAAAGVILGLGVMTAGCAKTTEAAPQTEGKEMSAEDAKTAAGETEDGGPAADGEEDREKTERNPDGAEDTGHDPEEADESGGGRVVNASQGTEYLGGKVQNPQTDGMTLAQTTIWDENGAVILLEEKDARKIPVKFTADTKAERWTVQGGGADIDMKEASLTDLKEGMGVELEGYFEGENFVATKVIIEEDV